MKQNPQPSADFSLANPINWNKLAKAQQKFAVFLRKVGNDEAAALYEEATKYYRTMPGGF